MVGKKANFIIVDDSALDCFIAEKQVKHAQICNEVKSYLGAQEALDYIKSSSESDVRTVVLLDVMMPMMSGIEFVEEFEKLPGVIQRQFFIVAFTSSMNKKDMGRIKSFPAVRALYDKPLNIDEMIPLLKENGVIS